MLAEFAKHEYRLLLPIWSSRSRSAAARRGVPAADIVATGRDIARITTFAERGVVVRQTVFEDPRSLAAAFAGADKLLLISTTSVDERVANHRRAAVVVLTTEGHTGAVYELGGDESFTLAELAATVSTVTGKPIAYTDLPAAKLVEALTGAGVPAHLAPTMSLTDAIADASR